MEPAHPSDTLQASTATRARREGIRVLVLFGTRPEIIKLAPVIRELEQASGVFTTVNVTTAQHTDLLYPLAQRLGVRIDHDLKCMEPGQTLNGLLARILIALDPVLIREQPDLILVQGDASTALAGALAGFHRRIAVSHVEAGLRSGCRHSPYPEEMNRRLITQLATYHFAATPGNRGNLLAEGVPPENIFLTGNPVIDALSALRKETSVAPVVERALERTSGLKRLVLTTHRRESFGPVLAENLRVLRGFVERHDDVALLFPVHPNPAVQGPAREILSDHPRIVLLEPLEYPDFIGLLSQAWLIVSDSGGVQEEAPTLGKPLLVLRENTERPEVLETGVARLVGGKPQALRMMLESAYRDPRWAENIGRIVNPFGSGDSAKRIVQDLDRVLRVPTGVHTSPGPPPFQETAAVS